MILETKSDVMPANYTGKATFEGGLIGFYYEGKLHCDDGPALIYPNGDKCFYKQGLPHNAEGPAVIKASGENFYYLEGQKLSFEEWLEKLS